MKTKPKVAVHKFASCDGCQLAFLNLGEDLLQLFELVEIVHFAEAGPVSAQAKVDIAFVEGSVSTPEDIERIKKVRENSDYVIAIGACATAGGLQALRNSNDAGNWIAAVYAQPQTINSLAESMPVAAYIDVDLELWGCPVNSSQVLAAVRSLLFGVTPREQSENVCLECKRAGHVCVLVTRGTPCMGPVTRGGCGALCPAVARDCYACYGPAENSNTAAFTRRLKDLGLSSDAVARRFHSINNTAPVFQQAGHKATQSND